jgi:hypothetical protein
LGITLAITLAPKAEIEVSLRFHLKHLQWRPSPENVINSTALINGNPNLKVLNLDTILRAL